MAQKESDSESGYAEALRRIEKCRFDSRESLDLCGLELKALPPEIGQLSSLRILLLSHNQLTELPQAIGHLKAMTTLVLSKNKLISLPSEIGQISSLVGLHLAHNQLRSVPAEIGQLSSLIQLNLANNQLSALPIELGRLHKLVELNLHGNRDLGIPLPVLGEVISRPYEPQRLTSRPADILNFYFTRQKELIARLLRPVNEIKVMLVGRGGAGKTSLRRYFMRQPHNKGEPETPGIALDTFPLQCSHGTTTVRLWDFAGQEITHALHQFFLTEGCVYILVLDPRSNTEMQDAEYWLGMLTRYAKGAPVLVVLNRQDARTNGYDIDRRVLEERFPAIHSFTRTNCEARVGCDELKQQLCEAIETLTATEPPHLQVPQTWLNVMQACDGEAKAKRQRLTLDQFREICSTQGETDSSKQESLARLLHKLGAVLHFVDEPRLRDTAVLNPHWVTDGVYRLLRFKEAPGSDGTLTIAEALKAVPNTNESEVRFLLRLMERFEMCFPLDEEVGGAMPTKWLIPASLDEFQPAAVTKEWQRAGSVRLRYVYDPLPEGVLPRFIVLTNLLSEGQPRWRNGVVLKEGAAEALIRRGQNRNHVEVIAFGPDADRLRLLEIIQGNFDRIHVDLPDPKPIDEMELAGLPGIYRAVEDLEVAELGQQKVAIATPQGKVLVEPTPQLNQASEPASRDESRTPLHVFLSYSHEDKRAKQIFQNNLTVMQQKNFITHWHDGLIEPGMRWKEEIIENLTRMDVFVGLLTTSFLVSDFIANVEIKAAREKQTKAGQQFLFVLIMVDEISLTGLDLVEYQILRPGGKAVTQHKSRKEGFNVAQKELEILIQSQAVKRRPRMDDFGMRPRSPEIDEKLGVTILNPQDRGEL